MSNYILRDSNLIYTIEFNSKVEYNFYYEYDACLDCCQFEYSDYADNEILINFDFEGEPRQKEAEAYIENMKKAWYIEKNRLKIEEVTKDIIICALENIELYRELDTLELDFAPYIQKNIIDIVKSIKSNENNILGEKIK